MYLTISLSVLIMSLMLHELAHAWTMLRNDIPIKKIALGIPVKFLPKLTFKLRKYPKTEIVISPLLLAAFVQPTNDGIVKMDQLHWKKQLDIFNAGPWMNIIITWFAFLVCNFNNLLTFKGTMLIVAITSIMFLRKTLSRYLLPLAGVAMAILTAWLIIHNPMESLSGPIGIVIMANQNSTTIKNSIEFGGILSFSIGIFNLLPIYPLDGGRTISLLLNQLKLYRVEKYFKIAGPISFLLLMSFATFFDLLKLF